MNRENWELENNKRNNRPKILGDLKGIDVRVFKKEEYDAYLRSSEWQAKRQEAIDFYKSCVLCNSKKNLNVHHRRYVNWGGNENIGEDLVVLCYRCHGHFHAWKNKKKKNNRRYRKKKKSKG